MITESYHENIFSLIRNCQTMLQNHSTNFHSHEQCIRISVALHSCCVHMHAQSLSLSQLFVTPWTLIHQPPLSMEFSRQKYWGGLPFSSPGELPNPGIKYSSLVFPALTGRLFYHWHSCQQLILSRFFPSISP